MRHAITAPLSATLLLAAAACSAPDEAATDEAMASTMSESSETSMVGYRVVADWPSLP
jgi:predicted outer membrane protein